MDFYKCKCEKEDHYNKSQTKPLGFNRPLTLWYGWSSVVRQERSTLDGEGKKEQHMLMPPALPVSAILPFIFLLWRCVPFYGVA